MPKPEFPSLPFITRDMLTFGRQADIDVEVVSYGNMTSEIKLIGSTRDGIFKFPVKHVGDGSAQSDAFGLPDFPMFLTLFTDSALVERGEFYASVYLRLNKERVMKLCSGYISKQSGIGWPASESKTEFEGGGKHSKITGTNPTAGSNIDESVPTNEHWILNAIVVTLTTDANVADRQLLFKLTLLGGAELYVPAPVVQPASTTRFYHFAPYGSAPITNYANFIFGILPPGLHLGEGTAIESDVYNLQVGDDFSSPIISVEQFFED